MTGDALQNAPSLSAMEVGKRPSTADGGSASLRAQRDLERHNAKEKEKIRSRLRSRDDSLLDEKKSKQRRMMARRSSMGGKGGRRKRRHNSCRRFSDISSLRSKSSRSLLRRQNSGFSSDRSKSR